MREFIPSKDFKNEEVLSALQWYFESKNYHLEEALKIKVPMSVESVKQLRINYSYYFISLMSGLELLRDGNYPHHKEFKKDFANGFIFNGFGNAEENYNYLKELRNCIVHRGYDIACNSRSSGNTPLLIAPESIPDRNGNKEYVSFGVFIINLIESIESVVGGLVFEHAKKVNLFKPTFATEEQLGLILKLIRKMKFIPEPVRKMALEEIPKLDLNAINLNQFSNFEKIIKNNVLNKHI